MSISSYFKDSLTNFCEDFSRDSLGGLSINWIIWEFFLRYSKMFARDTSKNSSEILKKIFND